MQYMRIALSHAAFWLVLCLVGATGSHSDALRSHDDVAFLHLFWSWCWNHVPVCMLGMAVQAIHRRWPDCFFDGKRVAAGYVFVVLVFLPLELMFIAVQHVPGDGIPPLRTVLEQVLAMRRFGWFTELAWTSGTYIGVIGLCVWRRHRQREQAWLQAERDNLQLRLQILRGQLEPHFMFNALNAISALVRSDDRALAVAGIRRLSDLLRYALAASEREWATLASELQFTRDYLALQRLRYGDRLQVHIEGDSAAVLRADCPPLLLQPLVENALRHGLDRNGCHGEIRMTFAVRGEELAICIVNPLVRDTPPNPGAGMGLRNVRARLQNAYGAAAVLRTGAEGEHYMAEIRMPLYGTEADDGELLATA
ncbi:histidine kinase [Massilia sp. METH4]|uniref:sensor histidine kinase n=1 Tax=Massilia sp. METH4 TaxID=3123041 RepID=UPI0030D45ECF